MKVLRALMVGGMVAGSVIESRACLNEYLRPPEQITQPMPTAGEDLLDPTKQTAVDWSAREAGLREVATAKSADFQARSDYAVALLHLGRAREAIGILEPLAQVYSREYTILANLGTAYELDGQLDRALRYISKATQINPTSHEGTEWLHEKILSAKIGLAKNPAWLKNNSVLGQKFGVGVSPGIPAALKKKPAEAQRITKAIIYQLRERLQFVRPPDATVADLLFDLGNLYVVTGHPDTGIMFYNGSLKFGDLRKTMVERRIKAIREAPPDPSNIGKAG